MYSTLTIHHQFHFLAVETIGVGDEEPYKWNNKGNNSENPVLDAANKQTSLRNPSSSLTISEHL